MLRPSKSNALSIYHGRTHCILFIAAHRAAHRQVIMDADLRKHSLGWIGLGRMGCAMAERLAVAGCDIAGYNRTRAKAEPLTASGVKLVESPAGLADRDIVFTMVSTASALRQVTTGEGGVLSVTQKAPKILADCSTVSEEASAELRAAAAARGTMMLVVPVSGNDQVARAGKLSVLASGPREAYDVVAPYLSCFGPSVSYIGEGDLARSVKISHNMLLGILFQAVAECTVLAEKRGVPRHLFLDVINKSVLGSLFTRYKSPGIINLDFTVTFTHALLRKDLDLGLEAAKVTGANLPLTRLVRNLVQECIDKGEAEADYTTLFLRQAEASGLVLKPENVKVADGLN
jgi:3-hydroxyisobutyrate dehydrogenase